MALALFDLDNTLLAGDSDYLWGRFLVEQKRVDEQEYDRENKRFLELYQQGALDIYEFAEFAFKPLTAIHPETLKTLHQQFMADKILPIITDKARALVKKHKEDGDILIIITATNSFVTAPIAKEFDIDNLIATEPEMINGRYSGKISGTPCFKEGKITRLQEWLLEKHIAFEDCTFYSDSINDLPLLKRVNNPVVVDPDEKLAAYAKENNWPIISLR
ncbi:MAG: HAD-IB family hydrolase [Gammaproteobacteria bacterium]|nr:HAD-IB family hydrolase [Gammaproteobacteria bacterium]